MRLIYFFTIFAIISCTHSPDKGSITLYKYFGDTLTRIKYFSENNILSLTPLNKDSLPNGVETIFNKYGFDSVKNTWDNGNLFGAQILYYPNGKPHKYIFKGFSDDTLYERHFNFLADSIIFEKNELTSIDLITKNRYKEEGVFFAKIYPIVPPKVAVLANFYLAKKNDTVALNCFQKDNLFIINEKVKDTSYSELIVKLNFIDSLKSNKWSELITHDLNSAYYSPRDK